MDRDGGGDGTGDGFRRSVRSPCGRWGETYREIVSVDIRALGE